MTRGQSGQNRGVLSRSRWSREDARRLLDEQAKSGLSLHRFARERNILPERLYRWRRELGRAETHEHVLSELSFAPVVVTGSRGAALVRISIEGLEIEIVEPTLVEPAWLVSVLAGLRGR